MDDDEDDLRAEVLSALSERTERLGERLDQVDADLDALAQAHATQSDASADLAARWETQAALLADLGARLRALEAAHDPGGGA